MRMAVYMWLLPMLLLAFGSSATAKKYHDKYDHYYDYPQRPYYEVDSRYTKYEHYEPPPSYQTKTHTFVADYGPEPPPHDQIAKMARYIVHNADWAAIATHASQAPIRGYPSANVLSVSDGPINNSSGVPYMYISPLESDAQDLEADPRCSMVLSLAELDYCSKNKIDPQDPRCARVCITGRAKKIKPYSSETEFAQSALFSRHPAMHYWPKSHGFYFAKIKIEQVIVLDYYGGPQTVPLQQYFNPGDVRKA